MEIPKVGDIFICSDDESDFKAKVLLTHNISGVPLASYMIQVIDRIPPMKSNGWLGSKIVEKRKDIIGLPFMVKASTFWKNFKPFNKKLEP